MLTTTSSATNYQDYTNSTITAASTNDSSATLNYNNIYSTGTGNYVWTTSTVGWESLEDQIKKIVKDEINEKEKDKTMDFNFGPYNSNNIRLSIYGIAIKNKAGKWVSYNKDTQRLIDVEVLNINIDSSKIFYKLPKATNSIEVGDIIIHNGKPVFVEKVREDGKFEVIDPYEGTAITILPLNSPFGFNFIESLVSLTDCMPNADEDNPFGNLLPLMLAGNGDNSALAMAMMMDNSDIDPMMMLLFNGKDNCNLSTFLLMKMMKKEKKKKKKTTEEQETSYYIQL